MDFTIFGVDASIVLIRLLFLSAVVVIAAVVQHLVIRAIRHVLPKLDKVPRASIILNLTRVVIWSIALILVLEPVFGVKPTAFVSALGITSVALSLGLKDTISNVIGGFTLMVSNVISIGDNVTISGITGTVKDLTWRHTVVVNRLGENVVIPNSVLNTTSIVRRPEKSESLCTIPFIMKPGEDVAAVARDLCETIEAAHIPELHDEPGMQPTVLFEAVSAYGVDGKVYLFVRPDIPFAGVRDKVIRAIARKPYFAHIALVDDEGAPEVTDSAE